jgi:hypothetical protein
VAGLIDAVGTAIRSAAPRHLIGVHLGGGSALSDYDQFQGKSWLSLQVFQSGHGGGTCAAGVTDDYAKFACRARSYALRFRCIGEPASNATCANSGAPTGQPAKPAVNVEGQYETLGNNETRVQTRHTGWNSGLSGSFGFNIGVFPDIAVWTNPTAYGAANHLSDDDLGRMKGLFRSMPWSDLPPRHDLLIEQNGGVPTPCSGIDKANWLQLWKPYLALDAASGYGLVYLPRPKSCGTFTPSANIVLDRAKADVLGIACATWKGKWISPGDTLAPNGFASVLAKCDSSSSGVQFSVVPGQVGCGEICDRVLVLTKNKTASGSSPNVLLSGSPSTVDLQTEVELSDDGQTSTITGRTWRDGFPLVSSPVALSGSDLLFRKLPAAALDASGNFLVVWEEENGAGTDDIVAARFSPRLQPLGQPFVLNDTLDGQQAEPWASGDDSGNTVAVWTSYSEDDQIAGDIYGKVLDSSGQPLGSEFLVSTDNQGNQSMPQVQMDGDGGFVVAWTQDLPVDPPVEPAPAELAAREQEGGVYYRVFGVDGRARGPERRVDSGNPGRDRLSRLEVRRHGSFKIRWRAFDATGRDQGEREQDCDRDGNPSGDH